MFNSVQLLSCVPLFATSWTAACQVSLSITNFRSPPKLMFIEPVMPSNHLILCRPLLLLPSIFPSIRVFSNESALRIRWPKYWSFSFNISPSNEHPGLISFRMDWLDLLAAQDLKKKNPKLAEGRKILKLTVKKWTREEKTKKKINETKRGLFEMITKLTNIQLDGLRKIKDYTHLYMPSWTAFSFLM